MARLVLVLSFFLLVRPLPAQERNEDSTSIPGTLQSFLGFGQPKLGFMAQFAAEGRDNGRTTTSEFTIRNLRLYLSGSSGNNFRYFFQGSLNRSFEMLDLKLSYFPHDLFRIDGGRFKTPFGVEYLINDAKLLFVKRSTVVTQIGTLRKYGVQGGVSLLEKRLQITTGIFGGDSTLPKKISLAIAKIHTIPLKAWRDPSDLQIEFGGSLAYTGLAHDIAYPFISTNIILYNINSRISFGRLWLQAEYFSATSNSEKTEEGFYIDGGVHITEYIEGALRLDFFRPFQSHRERKYLVGFNYVPLEHIKLQIDYERDETSRINSGWFNCQYAINFE